MSNPEWLEHAARRGQSESWTLAHTFARYRQLEERTEAELARELGCTREVLLWLSLCRRPQGADFDAELTTIAQRHAVDLLALVRVIRHVEIVEAMSHSTRDVGAHAHPILIAARDRVRDGDKSS
ncbi:hypothetical protein ACN469_15995 [Corallococcus terminator]